MSTLSISGTFTATGTSAEASISRGDLSISGTFSATIQLQRFIGSEWRTVETITAPTELVIEPGRNQTFRLNCSSFTSGTVSYVLG